MEAIGDSNLIPQEPEQAQQKTVKFDLNSGDFEEKLANQEMRLAELEAKQVEIKKNLEQMFCDIAEEKLKYRKVVDGIIEVREKLSRQIAAFDMNQQDEGNDKTGGIDRNLVKSIEDAIKFIKSFKLDVDKFVSEVLEEILAEES